ncbi:MAG TPA: pilin [bacterium]|nr:pilin [bacterium]
MFKNKKIFLLFSFILLVGILFLVKSTLASGDVLGIQEVEDTIVLKSADPRNIIVRIVNIFLGLLGIIAVSLIIYGGILWMTSEGNEERITKAKSVLKNAAIGLAIVLAAWGIVTFIFRALFPDGTGNGNNIPTDRGSYVQLGLGAIGNCSIESVYPEPEQKAVSRNTMIMINFKEAISSTTFNSSNVFICQESNFDFASRSCSAPTEFTFETNDNKGLVITPSSYLGNENGFSNYIVYLSSGILKEDESASIFSTCSGDYFLWGFEVSNLLDLTPPKIESIFPQPDNAQDQVSVNSALSFATAQFGVIGQPTTYQPAGVISSTNGAGTIATTTVNIGANYNGLYTNFSVVIDSTATKAQLLSGSTSLGAFDIANSEVNFPAYFIVKFNSEISAGNFWNIEVKKRVLADTITVGNYVYTFIDGDTNGYNIKSSSNSTVVAQQIAIALNSHPNIDVSNNSAIVYLTSKVGGVSGNSIIISSSNPEKISYTSFSGGADQIENIVINGKKDKPMNSVVQINFNEAINPLMVSGESFDVFQKIRILNNNSSAKNDGEVCAINEECKSFKCNQGLCVGDYLSGKFSISSNFKTVEFKSDNKCGVNGCGEDIFCLPPMSDIRIELVAASLFNCQGDSANCSNKAPFSTCSDNICVNGENKRYPLSNMTLMNGIMDAAGNSLDGNSDNYSYGPVSYYNKNLAHNPLSGDSFRWSFWTSNKIETAPPVIESITPGINASSVDIYSPVIINFNKLMMGSTLKSGNTLVGGKSHRLINLISGQLVGYWISSENKDVSPADGEPDKTTAYINHARFFELADYTAQAGSGVRDIYQNCFKPSAGPGEGVNTLCAPTALQPFCCNGVPKSSCDVE